MELTVLGCAGTYPGPAGACSGYLVEAEGYRLLLDVGNGVLGPLQEHASLLGVDAVLVSHLHADHVVDLVPYAYARHYHPSGSAPQIPVLGPSGTRDRVAGLFDGPPGALDRTYSFSPLVPGRFELGPFLVGVERMNHPVETFGVRVEHGGGVLAYSADTDETEALDRLAAGAGVFLCEASFLHGHSNPRGVHLTGRQAGGGRGPRRCRGARPHAPGGVERPRAPAGGGVRRVRRAADGGRGGPAPHHRHGPLSSRPGLSYRAAP